MAKTLQQAGGQVDGGVLPTSQQISSSPQVQGANVQAGASLAKDLMGIMGSTANIVQDANTLSVKAANRAAADNLTEMSIKVSEVESMRTPDSDLREERDAIEAIYQFYGNKTFDNEDAQREFDKLYHGQGGEAIAAKASKLNRAALKQDADKLFTSRVQNMTEQLKTGVAMTNGMYKTEVEIMTAGGFYTEEQAGGVLVKALNQNIEGVYETLDDLDVYGADGIHLDVNKVDKEANKYYDAVATIKDGEWEGKAGVPDSVVQSAQNTFNKLIDTNRKARTAKLGFSAIPSSEASLKIAGQTSSAEAKNMVKSAYAELEEKRRLFPNIDSDPAFQKLVLSTEKMVSKTQIIINQENKFKEFSEGMITWEGYLNETAKTTTSFSYLGQTIKTSATQGDSISFAQKQVDNYEDELRASNYDANLATGKNPYASIGELEIKTGGALKSSYLKQNSTNLGRGNVSATTYGEFKSEYGKTVDYMQSKSTLEDTWLNASSRKNVSLMFRTLDSQVESGAITEEKALLKAKVSIEAWENSNNLTRKTKDIGKLAMMKELMNFDAEDANDYGWLNVGLGDEVYGAGTLSLVIHKFADNLFTSVDEKTNKKIIAENMLPLRSKAATTMAGSIVLPWRKTIMLYKGDRKVSQDNAAKVVAQRIQKDLGKAFSDITDDNVVIRQGKDDSGEIITNIAVRGLTSGEPVRIYTFTMDELAKGVVAETNREKAK